MKKIFGVSSLALLLSLAACNQGNEKEAQLADLKQQQTELQEQIAQLEAELQAEGKGGPVEKKTMPVTVAMVETDTFRHYLEVQGRVDFDQNVFVSAKVPGVLTSVRVKRGDKVAKGQTMATIDAQVLEQNIAEVRTRLELATVAYERQKNLWDQKIGTEMQYLTAKNNKEALERSLGTLQQQRDQFNVKAPVSGIVDNVIPNAGEAVSPGIGIIRVVNTSGTKIVAEVSEAYLTRISKGDEALVRFPDLNQEITATVDVISSFINPGSRTFTIELRPKNVNIELRPNLIAVVRIQDYRKEDAVIIPVNLVQRDETSQYVYVAKQQGNRYVATRREVETGVNYQGQVEVLKGLSAKDYIITAGYQSVNEGQPVIFDQESIAQH